MADSTTAGLRIDEAGQRRQVRRAVIASTVGTSIEWYDFFLYGTAAALVFPKLFFPHSSAYAGTLEAKEVAKAPVPEVVRHHWPEISLSTLVRLAEQAPFYIFTTYVLTYGTAELGLKRNFLLNAVLLAAIVSLFTTPFFGYLSDLIGRRRMYLIGALSILVFAFPYIGLLNTKTSALVVLAVVASIVCHDMMYGPQAAFIAESFPTRLRYSGASLGYQLASIVAGGPAPLIAAWLLHTFHSGYAISTYMAMMAVITAAAAAVLGARVSPLMHERELPSGLRRAVRA